ncbi:ExbD/TolR family protein [Yoonia sp. R2331]|uniref:ExbD/TolR family protein n=1 Tax=Yoonia sp. R2331 TaxID=3237238 RepID=UPI0034E491DA
MSKTRSKVALPRHTGRYNFVLTPLADAMFQLLIFFMLSSNLAPYSLLTLKTGLTGEEGAQSTGEAIPDEIAEAPANAAIWTVDAGQVTAQGQRFEPDQLSALAAALAANDDAAVVLILRDTAQVQDLSNVLEALTAAGVASVQIAESGGA